MNKTALHTGVMFLLLAAVALTFLIAVNSCDVQAKDINAGFHWVIYMNDGLDSLQEKPVDRWAVFIFDVADTSIAPFEDPALYDSSRLLTPPHLLYPDYLYGWFNHDSLIAVTTWDTTISGTPYKIATTQYITPEDGRYLSAYVFAYAADGDYSTGVGTMWESKPDLRIVRPAAGAWFTRQ